MQGAVTSLSITEDTKKPSQLIVEVNSGIGV